MDKSGVKQPEIFDVEAIRKDFPILKEMVHGNRLVYLDNAATTQKPLQVIRAVENYYRETNSNVHRGIHYLSEKATSAFEGVRDKIKTHINASSRDEIIFTRGTTEAINLVASSFGRKILNPGDSVLITTMEHHSNIVPWQMICEERGAKVKVVPINERGEIILEEYERLLTSEVKIVAFNHISNSLGTINPVKEMVSMAHEKGIPVLVDGAQALPHTEVDVKELDCDFYCFSGHKVYGPTGTGVLFGKKEFLEKMPPYHGGGEMIREVTFEKTTYNELPYKFEAGTPHIAGFIGLGAALDYVNAAGLENIAAHESDLLNYATGKLEEIDGLRIIGTAKNKAGVAAFHFDGFHPQDLGVMLDQQGIAIRTGHHCTQPLMKRFKVPATSRASFAIYNTREEVDILIDGIKKAVSLLM